MLFNRKDTNKVYKMKKLGGKGIVFVATIVGLGTAGLVMGGTTAEASEWTPNTSTSIQNGDTQYTIQWGDYLELISNETGITQDTLQNLNGIEDADVIYADTVINFGNGVTAVAQDSEGNTLAETPLTQEDKDGIQKVQEQKQEQATTETKATTTETKATTTETKDTTTKTTGTSDKNDGKTSENTVKPITPSTPDLKPSKPTTPVEPIAPVDPIKPVDPEKPTNPEQPTNPTDPSKPVDPETPTDPEKPTTPEVETVEVSVSYVDVDTMEVVTSSKETVELDKDGNGELIATTPKGFELVGDTHASITKDTKEIVFEVKKVAEVKEVTVQVLYQEVDADGQVVKLLGADTITADEGSNVKAEAKTFDGYKLTSNQTQVAENVKEGDKITFNYTKEDAPYVPVNTNEYQTIKKDTEGNILQSTEGYTFVSKSTDKGEIIYTAPNGDTTTLYTTTEIYKKDSVYVPVHTEETVTVNVDTDGYILKDTTGYTQVSESTDSGATTTQPNGDTHTIYTKTIVWEKQYTPTHRDEYVTVNVDESGNTLSSTSGYTKVSESTTENTVTSANGDTVTTHTTTVVWKKDQASSGGVIVGEWNGQYYDGLGNSGMTFANTMEAMQWAVPNSPSGSTGYSMWEVRMAGTNEIRITVDFY